MSELPCPYCGFNCVIPSDTEEKIECPSCKKIFLYIQQSESNGEIDCRPLPEINDGSRQMSELKWNWVYFAELDPPEKQKESALKAGYIKMVNKIDADKVIAELEKNLSEIQSQKMQLEDDVALLRRNNAELKKQVHDYAQGLYVMQARGEKELRHYKYKRCFKMSRWCVSMMVFNSKYGTAKKWHLFKKWRDRWLELAEKFKEEK